MKAPNSFPNLNKSQRNGIVWTFVLFFTFHLVLFFASPFERPIKEGLVIDVSLQEKIDSITAGRKTKKRDTIYPVNPNYISDFKAYQLNIPIKAVKRIRAFIDQGNYINSIATFQKVTLLSNSEVGRLKPYLRIPKTFKRPVIKQRDSIKKIELNTASPQQLTRVYGIGDAFANRIVTLRDKLGGFLVRDQLADVWGLSKETQARLWTKFSLESVPSIKKKNINKMTIAQLSSLHYIQPSLASSIVAVRTQKGTLNSWNDLAHIQQLDSIKRARLSLYLSFN
ncbi:MAG: helix-hairpin-helix domain-containing protein [Flavobacteriaceae bacterium]